MKKSMITNTLSRLVAGACLGALMLSAQAVQAATPLVLMTDFGTADGAVSAMHGVAYGVDPKLTI